MQKLLVAILAAALVIALALAILIFPKAPANQAVDEGGAATSVIINEPLSRPVVQPQQSSEPPQISEAPTSGRPAHNHEPLDRPQYQMQLELDTAAKRIDGTVQVLFMNDSRDDWDEICFRDFNFGAAEYFHDNGDAVNSGIQSDFTDVKDSLTGESLEWRRDSDPSIVWLTPEAPLAPGERMEVEIAFYSDIPYNYDLISWVAVDDERLFFELGNFYPVLAIYEEEEWQLLPFTYQTESFYSLCADYDVSLTLPDEYLVISTGDEQPQPEDNGLVLWQLSAGNTRDFAITAANGLSCMEVAVGDTVVNTYYYEDEPKGLTTRLEAELMQQSASLALELFEEKIGVYPYDELDVVPSFGEYGGLEYPGLVRISILNMEYLGRENSAARWQARYEAVSKTTAHEVAHQWFYAVVGNNSYNEPWLDEAFASFCERYIYMREVYSEADFKAAVKQERELLRLLAGDFEWQLDLSAIEYKSYYHEVYVQGALFLYDIMLLIGEEDFFAMLSDYYSRYSFLQAGTSDFLEILYEYTQDDEVWGLVSEHFEYSPEN